MRFKVYLNAEDNYFPANFDDILASAIYGLLNSISKEYFDNFKFYNFSYFNLENSYSCDDGSYYARDGNVSFIVSSVNDDFLRLFISKLILEGVCCENNHLNVSGIKLLDTPDFTKNNVFITASPIQVNIFKCNNDLLKYLTDLLLSNYDKVYGKYSNPSLNIYVGDLFEKYNSLNEDSCNYYYMQVILEGDIELIRFAWDIGLGESNFKGFGMLGLDK